MTHKLEQNGSLGKLFDMVTDFLNLSKMENILYGLVLK